MKLTGQITPTSLLQFPSLNGIRRLGCLQWSRILVNTKWLCWRSISSSKLHRWTSSKSQDHPQSQLRGGTTEFQRPQKRGRGGHCCQTNQGNPESGFGCFHPMTPSPKAQASQNWSENNEFLGKCWNCGHMDHRRFHCPHPRVSRPRVSFSDQNVSGSSSEGRRSEGPTSPRGS